MTHLPVSSPRTSAPTALLILLFFAGLTCFADNQAVASFLTLGPIPAKFLAAVNSKDHKDAALSNLTLMLGGGNLPREGMKQTLFGDQYTWTTRQTAMATGHSEGETTLTILSLNLETGRFSEGDLVFTWPGEIHLFSNQQAIKAAGGKEGEHRFAIKATTGSHHLLVFVSGDSGKLGCEWQGKQKGRVEFHLEPQKRVSATQLYHTKTVSQLQLSPDGNWVAVGERGWDTAAQTWSNRFEIRDFNSKAARLTWLQETPSQFHWRPDSGAFAFKKGGDLWVQSMADGSLHKVLAGMKAASIIEWHPDGKSLWITLDQDGSKDAEGVKRYRALEDRWQGWRDIQQIGRLDLDSGMIQVFTDEAFGASFEDLDQTGSRLLFTTSPPKYSEPPHSIVILKLLDTASGEITTLGEFLTFNSARFYQGGYLVSAGPSAFNGAGNALGGQSVVNDYDAQLYFWDGTESGATCYTKLFDPSIDRFEILPNGEILLLVTENDERPLYTYDPKNATFRAWKTDVEIVEQVTVSKTARPIMVWSGTSATTPQKVFATTLGDPPELWFDPAEGAYDQTVFGKVLPWNFTSEAGSEIIGRFYTPPGFSAENRYPLIVYYYGGTVPVNRQFTGRYPFNLWAANGYVVYVLQPSGTIGMGQRFSSLHVNAWGRKTAEDIVAGTGQFIKAHPFIDEDRVGCIGASYGGFMTMYLITKTNAFRAAISHAGISDLSGYWGEGWWGYSYSGVASRGSFPWNNAELYTESSPLFHADQITTPLLLLHGDADTNVPPGQSHDMYTALKLLGKEVEFITFDGENHHILNPKLRLIWWDTILAWFDMQLKDQPAWWQSLYPTGK